MEEGDLLSADSDRRGGPNEGEGLSGVFLSADLGIGSYTAAGSADRPTGLSADEEEDEEEDEGDRLFDDLLLDRLSGDISDDLFDDLFDNLSDDFFDDLFDDLSDDLSDRFLDDLSGLCAGLFLDLTSGDGGFSCSRSADDHRLAPGNSPLSGGITAGGASSGGGGTFGGAAAAIRRLRVPSTCSAVVIRLLNTFETMACAVLPLTCAFDDFLAIAFSRAVVASIRSVRKSCVLKIAAVTPPFVICLPGKSFSIQV